MKSVWLKFPNKVVDEAEVLVERALDLKRRRAGHLGEERKRLNRVYELVDEDANRLQDEVSTNLKDYETGFHRFVVAHKKYLQCEDNEDNRAVAEESYDMEKQSNFRTDVFLNKTLYKKSTLGCLWYLLHKKTEGTELGGIGLQGSS